jgi:group I intron endonuclease
VTCGVYVIRNTVSGRLYVGSSVNIESRWAVHRHELLAGTHHSSILQRSWSKHGEIAFVFEVLLVLPRHLLIEYEQIFIDQLKPSMNIHPMASSPLGVKRSASTRLKLSLSKRGIQPTHLIEYSQQCIGKPAPHVAESNRRRKGMKVGPYTLERRANISLAKKGKPNLKNRGVKKPWLAELNRSRRKVFGPVIHG